MDDGPALAKQPTTPVTTVRKKSFFDKVAGVVVPGQKERPAVLEEERQTFHRMRKLRPLRPSHSKGMDRDWPS